MSVIVSTNTIWSYKTFPNWTFVFILQIIWILSFFTVLRIMLGSVHSRLRTMNVQDILDFSLKILGRARKNLEFLFIEDSVLSLFSFKISLVKPQYFENICYLKIQYCIKDFKIFISRLLYQIWIYTVSYIIIHNTVLL